ncbi:retrotransposon-related protein [Tanacetum coccineum]|uniref:Retrotransposon-related protein n=1 Tax=Tanacetum coccineum TaxID=301880 RepID=A0ABQ5HP37_9ASTR
MMFVKERSLIPLPIPEKIWSSISMDFIEKLPNSHGKTVILVVVDRMSKYAHFIALQHPFTASTVAKVFLDNVYRLHGMPESIISDRDTIFLSHFWQSLFKVLKVQLKMSTAYHPQTDSQTEIVNKCLECFLRCMTGERPKEWTMWLPMVYNTNFHSAINTTPFQTVYGQTPPLHTPYVNRNSLVESVDRTIKAREKFLQVVKFYLKRAQDRMMNQANKHRSEKVFEVPHRQVIIRKEHQHKLSSKYYGPFMIVERIGAVAYKLELPLQILSAEPVAILDRRLAKVGNRAVPYVLTKWYNHSDEDVTWENYVDLIQRYPKFETQA